MPDLRAGTTEALFVEGYRLHLRVAMGSLMKFLRLHDLNNPTQEVLIDMSTGIDVRPANGGTGSMVIHGDWVTFVHESRDEIETLVEEEQ
jgi:hypothetical protein